jgi:hypothetical protein
MKRCIALLLLCAVGIVFTGCPQPSGGNENANDNESPSNLTDAQNQAIEKGMLEIQSLIDVFSTVNVLADPQLAVDTLGPIGTFGECPMVSYLHSTTSASALISIDFGSGCSTLVTGNEVVGGLTTVAVNTTTKIATVDFTTLVFAGNAVQGELTSVVIASVMNGVNLVGNMTVSIQGTGQLVGTFDVTLTAAGRITINSAAFTVPAGPPSQITLSDVVVDPSLTLNLVPFQGSAQFDVPSASGTGVDQAVITLTTETSDNGTIEVQLPGLPATEFQVPGLV